MRCAPAKPRRARPQRAERVGARRRLPSPPHRGCGGVHARASLDAKVAQDPDFWSVIGQTELRWYEAVALRSLAPQLPALLAEIADLRARASSARQWASLADKAEFVLGPYAQAEGTGAAEREAVEQVLAALRDRR